MPTTITRTKSYDNRVHFMMWQNPQLSFNVQNTTSGLNNHANTSWLIKVAPDNTDTVPDNTYSVFSTGSPFPYNRTNYNNFPYYKGNAINVGIRMADWMQFYGYQNNSTNSLFTIDGKGYIGGIHIIGWGAETKFGANFKHHFSETADLLSFQGKYFRTCFNKASLTRSSQAQLDGYTDTTVLNLGDWITVAIQKLKSECDRRGLCYPAFCAWDWEGQIGAQVGISSIARDVRSGSWSNMGSIGLNSGGIAYSAITSFNNIVVAGKFTSVNNVSANNIAIYDGSTWYALGTGLTKGGLASAATVYAMTIVDTFDGLYLYVGGDFDNAGGVAVNNFARIKMNGTSGTWGAVANSNFDGVIRSLTATSLSAITSSSYTIFATGDFTTISGATVNRIAKMSTSLSAVETSWSNLGSTVGLNNTGRALLFADSKLYVAGDFTSASASNTITCNRVASYNPSNSTFATLGTSPNDGVNGSAYCLAILPSADTSQKWKDKTPNNIVVGGSFTSAGGVAAKNIAKFDGTSTWSAMSTGVDGTVRCVLAPYGSYDLFAGGEFATVNNAATTVNNVARWDNEAATWNPIGPSNGNYGMGGTIKTVHALIDWYSINGTVAIGEFDSVNGGSTTCKGITRFFDITKYYDVFDIMEQNLGNNTVSAVNRFQSETVYEEFDVATNSWVGKSFKNMLDEIYGTSNPSGWQYTAKHKFYNTITNNRYDPKGFFQSINRDFTRYTRPYFEKINDFVLYKTLFTPIKENLPGTICGNYNNAFPIDGSSSNYYFFEPRYTWARSPHENATIFKTTIKPQIRADYQAPVCYSPKTDITKLSANFTSITAIYNNYNTSGVPVAIDSSSDSADQRYYSYHAFGDNVSLANMYYDMNRQRVLGCLASNNLHRCIPWIEAPYENAANGDFGANSYTATDADILRLLKAQYDLGVRTWFVFNPQHGYWKPDANPATYDSTVTSVNYGTDKRSNILLATINEFVAYVNNQNRIPRGRLLNQ